MGEVYRADDLELGQTVALKFLPRSLTDDEAALTLLRNEVRLARQISHPNVCRVYDIGEVEGQHFVSMEYVDGEDLASLLRRIGRVSKEKASDLIGQMAAGLAASHELGILHRDLKPANIMLDGRGRARIMDFGLAGFVDEIRGKKDQAGTLVYMAPEQLTGRGASMRSDVYSLGLVMYELITGRRAYDGRSVEELRDLQAAGPPPSPSSLVSDLDPAVERIIMWCLEHVPAARPGSARAVAAVLPGGDPLAAAVAAGETPSPEMVAAAGGRGALPMSVGIALVIAAIAGFLLMGPVNNKVAFFRLAQPRKHPAVLADKARNILNELDRQERQRSVAYSLYVDYDVLNHIEETDSSLNRWERLGGRPTGFGFWYRESKESLLPYNESNGMIEWSDPPNLAEGMSRLQLDQHGRLKRLEIVTSSRMVEQDSTMPADWGRLFSLAELDPETFQQVKPLWSPPIPSDGRLAWEGFYPDADSLPVRIEAGTLNGRAVYFRLYDTYKRDRLLKSPLETDSAEGSEAGVVGSTQRVLWALLILGFVIVPFFIGWRNIRSGRADLMTSLRVGVFGAGLACASWVLAISRYSSVGDQAGMMIFQLGNALATGVVLGLGYLAAEPYLRRHWPDLLISWTRLARGQYRSQLVGRDVLIGISAGAATAVGCMVSHLVPTWFGVPVAVRDVLSIGTLMGGRTALAEFLSPEFLIISMFSVVTLLIFVLVLRRKTLAVIVTFVLVLIGAASPGMGVLSDPGRIGPFLGDAVFLAIWLIILTRFGLLAAVSMDFVVRCLTDLPITLDTSAWYSSTSHVTLIALAAITLYALRTATAGYRPPGREVGPG
jgi:serine/threonine-protein kinase